jgi:hypothetical protein
MMLPLAPSGSKPDEIESALIAFAALLGLLFLLTSIVGILGISHYFRGPCSIERWDV